MTPKNDSVKELREKKPEELVAFEAQLRSEVATLTVKMRTGQVQDTSRLSKIKKDIARILTLRSEQERKGVKKQ
ncbi:MAG: 50S ribosomal protein L29 [Deltaproteobacteria bacterium]|nr:50S ribosomal protein L29 [Deltaproteobacteria bacterium]